MGKYKGFKGSGMSNSFGNQPVYTLTNAEMTEIVRKEVEKTKQQIKDELSASVVHKFWDIYLLIILNLCYSKLGFKEIRLKRFKFWFEEMLDSIMKGYVSVEDLRQEMIDAGINVDNILDRKITEFETRDPRQMHKEDDLDENSKRN